MIAWWRSIGWAILAAGVGIAVLGLTGEDGWLEEADRSSRSLVARASFAQEFGLEWEWQEHQSQPNRWLWQGFRRLEQEHLPLWIIEFDESQSREFAHEMMGPISLSVLLNAQAQDSPALVLRYWPLAWLRSQEVSLQPLQEALQERPQVIAAYGLDWVNNPQDFQQQALALAEPLPLALPEGMDLLEVNAASLGWPQSKSLGKALWAGVPTALLANYEQEGALLRVPLLVRKDESLVATLPLLTALDLSGLRASDLQLIPNQAKNQFTLKGGEEFSLELDEQGRLAIPAKALSAEQGLLPRIAMEDFLPLLHQVEVPSIDEFTQQDEVAKNLLSKAEVLWLDEQNHQAGLSEAQALAQILNPTAQVQERELRVNRPLGAASLVLLALLMARTKRRSHLRELMLATIVLLILAFVSYLSIRLGHWWVSPLPGLAVMVLILFFRERQRWVQAARENLLAEQQLEQALANSPTQPKAEQAEQEEAAKRGE